MRTKRQELYLMVIILTIFVSLFFSVMFGYFLVFYGRFFETNKIEVFSIVYGVFSLATLFSALSVFLIVKKEFKKFFKKYENEDIVKENYHREWSALMITMIFSFLPFLLFFILMNAYLKSGLSSKQRKNAILILQKKRIKRILKLPNVKKALEKIPELLSTINTVIKFVEKKYESKENVFEYIHILLDRHKIEYDFHISQKDIYYQGMNI